MGNECSCPLEDEESETYGPNQNITEYYQQITVQPQARHIEPYEPHESVGNNDIITNHIRRQVEELNSIEEAIQNRFSVSDNDEKYTPSSDKLSEKILSKEGEFSNYLDGVYYTDCTGRDYWLVSQKFKGTTQKHYEIIKIQKIFNPHLKASYMLRKKEYSLFYGRENVKEELLFHGTKLSNVGPISTINLNWRLKGTSKGHIFGQGVSFTPISNYASHYSDKADTNVMLMFTVLISQSCVGTENMVLPPACESALYPRARYDTSAKPDGHVVVKFRDDEFYPSYLIVYKGQPIKKVVELKGCDQGGS